MPRVRHAASSSVSSPSCWRSTQMSLPLSRRSTTVRSLCTNIHQCQGTNQTTFCTRQNIQLGQECRCCWFYRLYTLLRWLGRQDQRPGARGTFLAAPPEGVLIEPLQTTEAKLTYTRHEPIGVVGQIIPWNFPCEIGKLLCPHLMN